ncbi:MAG TPA: ferritin-like domain-containing protein [Burkholderiaceae bacterium]|nr:ferritin-like domain-containing protein [Burkholderiaceae bacterium]
MELPELRLAAYKAFICQDIEEKQALSSELYAYSAINNIATEDLIAPHTGPGIPAKPEIIMPLKLDKKSVFTLDGHAAMVHSICHIEFNAINLALDAVWRFAHMPVDYYRDWLRVAKEEAYHFDLLRTHLRGLQQNADGTPMYDYGSFPAHGGLWDMCEKTKDDVTARMALVPRTLEARGLDATPLIQAKLRKANTPHAMAAVAILDIILRDEIGHVAVGNHWYNWLCARDGHEPVAYFRQLQDQYDAPKLRAPFNRDARLKAGFSSTEMDALAQ